MSAPVIAVEKINFRYPGGPQILENVNLELGAGEFLGLVGPNGGGKSTLLKIILGLLKPDNGKILVLGQSLSKNRTFLGYVPQFAGFMRDFPISVEETVLMGRLGKTRRLFGYTVQDREAAAKAMQETGIRGLRKRRLGELSGGQLQRVLIARALVAEPEILLLDEPTSNIDLRAEEDIFDLLKQLNARLSIILVSHDIGFITRYVNRVACLNRTLVCHPTGHLDGRAIQSLYPENVRVIQHNHL